MSTTIDSLDIKISTSAGSAAANLDELAEKLKKLKENSNLTTCIKNLQNLAGALEKLKANSSGLSGLDSLAKTMEKLSKIQEAPGLDNIARGIGTIIRAISRLDTSRVDGFIDAVRRLAEGLEPLTHIPDASGFTGMIAALSRIPNLLEKLDDQAVATFVRRLDELSAALIRVARQFENFPDRIIELLTELARATRSASNAQNGFNNGLDVGMLNLSSFLSVAQDVLGSIAGIRLEYSAMIADAMEWDGIQFRFGRAFGEDAQEVYEYAQKVGDVLKINVQQFMQYSSLYGSLLKGFGLAQEKVTTISIGLTELSYDIWAAYNDRYKTLEDASEAVRSAITGEIEPIRNAGIALTEASLQEYLDSVGMATMSIEKMSEAQKAEVRYAAMVEAAMKQGIVGTYAREMTTAEGAVRTLTQQLKTLGQALGSLFLPVLTTVVPWISAFASVLYDAAAAIAAFFNIDFFKIDWSKSNSGIGGVAKDANDAATALGGAGAAAKKLKDYTMGFDELNIIDPDTASGGGGGGGAGGAGTDWEGLDLETLWDDSIFAQASKQVDELKQKILDWFDKWKIAIATVSAALATIGMAKMLQHLGEAVHLGDRFVGAMDKIIKVAGSVIVITLEFALVKSAFSDFMSADGTIWDYIRGMLIGGAASWVLYSQWGPAGLVIGFGVMAVASLSAIIENGGIKDVESATVALSGLAAAVTAVAIAWKKVLPAISGSSFGAFISLLRQGNSVASVMSATFPNAANAVGQLVTWFTRAGTAVSAFVGGLSATALAVITAAVLAVASAAYFLAENWDKVKAAAQGFFESEIKPKLDAISQSWDDLCAAVKDAWKTIKGILPEEVIVFLEDFLAAVVEAFKSVDILEAIGEAFEFFGSVLFGVVSGLLSGVTTGLLNFVNGVIRTLEGLVKFADGLIEVFVATFGEGDIEAAVDKMIDGVIDIIGGLWDGVVGSIVEFFDGVIKWFTELYDELVGHSIVPDTIDEVVEWFKSLPGKVVKPLRDFVDNVITKFLDMKQGVATKLNEVKTAITGKWSEIQTWFEQNVAPKLKLSYWTNKLSEFVDVGKSVIENIKSGLKTQWNELKKWWEGLELPEFKIKSPHLTWTTTEAPKWIGEILEALGMPAKIPKLKVDWYAQGGFPGINGDLFIANEAGPEMVGQIGSRNAVVNNDQIVAAVSQGVYAAVVSAMSQNQGQSGNQNVNVYLDGKQIYASVKKTERSRGVNLMGSQLGYSY